ncbi:TetR/AcrR family transcriptional regulator [Gracilibacillus alcaliphilus]|uniref:TetR/AcrR family transcriptional regulator n=1 Tax=Gracilibacillus alcaliphilus TaxID=1401441 RepID=UPI001958D00C|nr:TetR/AcrR family transcriptional regulator [Gracilibacillus alcaliphilus]MBM7676511.1 AcrR family transcriptional regulator [Gracilibacillus alcaliphilus]
MDGFERRKQQKKQAILQASLSLFQTQGIKKVPIAEIAKAANVSQVTIYNYFESKENLLEEVLIYYVDQIWQDYQYLFTEDISFDKKIKQMLFGKVDIANDINGEFLQFLMQYYTTEGNYIEKLYREEVLPAVMQLLQQGREEGLVHEQISDQAMLFYLQMFAEYLKREDLAPQIIPMTEDLTRLFFYGIAGEEPASE